MSDPTVVPKDLPPRRITEVARELGLDTDRILPHGHCIAKIPLSELHERQEKPDGQLILITAMSPTPQGEGKTTATIAVAGALALAQAVLRRLASQPRPKLHFLYPPDTPIKKQIETLATQLYGAEGVDFDRAALAHLQLLDKHGFGTLPICVAKTAMSLSDDPDLRGRPTGFRIKVNEFRLAAGAGFVITVCGNILTMPGLPKIPAAAHMKPILADPSSDRH